MSILMAALAGMAVWAQAQGAGQVFNLTFDDGVGDPILSNNVRLTQGRSGQAAEFVKGSELAYACDGRFNPDRGTLDLWIRPNWNSRDVFDDRYFWGVDNDPGKENRSVLGHLGRDGKGILYFGGDGALLS